MKMTKRICALLFTAAILLTALVVPAAAGTTSKPRVVDNADLLTDAQESEISSMLTDYSAENKCDIVFLTEPDLTHADLSFSGTAQDYADRYQETHGYDKDTVLMFITLKNIMKEQHIHIAAKREEWRQARMHFQN